MPAMQESQIHLETAHILFLDVVGEFDERYPWQLKNRSIESRFQRSFTMQSGPGAMPQTVMTGAFGAKHKSAATLTQRFGAAMRFDLDGWSPS
jgi:hypothetical protein